MESEGEEEIRMTPRIPTRNLTGKWLMHTSDAEGTVCSWGKRCSFTFGHVVIEWLTSWSLSGNTKKADKQSVLGSQKRTFQVSLTQRLGNVNLGATIMQMVVETRMSLRASFFIVGPKGSTTFKRMVTLSNKEQPCQDFEYLWLEADPLAKELEKAQLVKKQRNSGEYVLTEAALL